MADEPGDSAQEKTLEARVAELEDKMSKVHITEDEMKAYHKVSGLLGGAAAPGVATVGGMSAAGDVDECGVNECSIRQPIVSQCIIRQPIISQCIIRQCIIRQCIIRQCTFECYECGPCGAPGGGYGGGGFGGFGA